MRWSSTMARRMRFSVSDTVCLSLFHALQVCWIIDEALYIDLYTCIACGVTVSPDAPQSLPSRGINLVASDADGCDSDGYDQLLSDNRLAGRGNRADLH